MKVAFMGSDPIALPMLEFIDSGKCPDFEIVIVFTQPDRRTGRGMQLQENEIKAWALSHSIPVEQPAKCGHAEAALIKDLGIDLVLVMAYGQFLPKCILQAPALDVMNLHASLLPRLRGASPIHTAIAQGLDQTGISLMKIVPKMDAGPVADQEVVPISPTTTSTQLIADLASATVPLIERTLGNILDGSLAFEVQDPDKVTYCRIIEKTDRHLDFNKDAHELYNRIRALQPWPGTAFPVNDIEIRILESEVLCGDAAPHPVGTVLRDSPGMRIVCGKHTLKPLVLQRPGGKPLAVEDFLRGYPIQEQTILASREMRPLEQVSPFPCKKK